MVITVSEPALREASRALGELVLGSGYRPSHVVAIANGGVPVANGMLALFPDVVVVTVKVQRPGTASVKASPALSWLVARLPEFATSILRRAEHWWRYRPRNFSKDPLNPSELLDIDWPECGTPRGVLVVDDAVDTGLSLERVVFDVRRRFGDGIDVRTAALTVSGVNPRARCDYYLFRDNNLRFFWAKDYRR
jgi:hypoxanthine phosphoribosyltransferase